MTRFKQICVSLLLLLMTCTQADWGTAQAVGDEKDKAQPVAQPKKKDPPPYDPRLPGKIEEKKEKDDKKDDAPPNVKVVGTDEDGATLPFTHVRNKLESMKDGTKAYISVDSIRVDSKRRLWLHPLALLGPKSGERPILVSKETAGYGLVIEGTANQWDAEDFDPGPVKWIMVKTLQVK
jgi:hypothetical protein